MSTSKITSRQGIETVGKTHDQVSAEKQCGAPTRESSCCSTGGTRDEKPIIRNGSVSDAIDSVEDLLFSYPPFAKMSFTPTLCSLAFEQGRETAVNDQGSLTKAERELADTDKSTKRQEPINDDESCEEGESELYDELWQPVNPWFHRVPTTQSPHEVMQSVENPEDYMAHPNPRRQRRSWELDTDSEPSTSSRKRSFSDVEADADTPPYSPQKRTARLRPAEPKLPDLLEEVPRQDRSLSASDFMVIARNVLLQVNWEDVALSIGAEHSRALCQSVFRDMFQEHASELYTQELCHRQIESYIQEQSELYDQEQSNQEQPEFHDQGEIELYGREEVELHCQRQAELYGQQYAETINQEQAERNPP
ncbi:MAG: hypothetical protein M1839_003793 [Geoglossum umbratile]|nr:MAG: hypothetical protein M1839_003793 [Geoglossum umbratile]